MYSNLIYLCFSVLPSVIQCESDGKTLVNVKNNIEYIFYI